MTEDAIRAELAALRQTVVDVRTAITDGRKEAIDSHERLRKDLTERLSDAVEAKVRIEILEDNQQKTDERLEAQARSATETRRFVLAQAVTTIGVVIALLALFLQWRHP